MDSIESLHAMVPARARDSVVEVFPRRKAGESASTPARGRSPVHLNYSAVAALFDTPQTEAARRLGISLTALKQASRKLGILRWPCTRLEKALARTKTLDLTEAGQVREPSRRGSESDGSLACASESTQPRLPKKCPSHAEFGDNVEAGCELGNDDLGWLLWTDTDRLDVSETEWQERVCAMYDVCTNGTQAYHGHHEGSTVFHM